MQKKIIVLAVAGAIGSIVAGSAFADAPTFYGRIDYGYQSTGGDSGGLTGQKTTNAFNSGIEAGSRIGLKGAEDIGNNLKGIYEVEFGINVDQASGADAAAKTGAVTSTGSAATWNNRHSYIGLTGDFGTAVGGRLDGVRYGIFQAYDPFGAGGMGNFTQITRQVDRANNAVAYITPNFNGFSGLVAYGTAILGANVDGAGLGGLNAKTGEAAGNLGDFKLNTIMGKYEQGPISVTLDWEQVKADNIGIGAGVAGNITDKITVTTVGGSYDLGVVKVSALYDTLKDTADVLGDLQKTSNFLIAVKAPMGAFTLKANYGKSQNKLSGAVDADTSKFGLGVDYALTKRTNLYADYGAITNGKNAKLAISAAANAYGPTGSYGGGSTGVGGAHGIDFGIAHKF
jgi:predicted porin